MTCTTDFRTATLRCTSRTGIGGSAHSTPSTCTATLCIGHCRRCRWRSGSSRRQRCDDHARPLPSMQTAARLIVMKALLYNSAAHTGSCQWHNECLGIEQVPSVLTTSRYLGSAGSFEVTGKQADRSTFCCTSRSVCGTSASKQTHGLGPEDW